MMTIPSTPKPPLARKGTRYPVELIFLSLLSLIVLGMVGVLVWGESRVQFPNDDIVVYAVIAKLWGQGLVPYRDVVDHKPPLIYAFFRLCFWLGGDTPKALYQGYTLLTGAIMVGLIFSFRQIARPYLGILVGFAYAFFFLTDPLNLGAPAFLNTELLASAFLAITLGLLVVYRNSRSGWLAGLAGSAFGCAVMSKQPSLVFGIACLAHLVTSHWRPITWRTTVDVLRGGVCFCLGALVPLLGYIAYFAANNALSDFVFFAYSLNIRYSGMQSPFSALRLAIFHEHILSIIQNLKQPTALPYVVGLLAVPIVAVVRRSWVEIVSLAWLISSVGSNALNLQGSHIHYNVFYQVPLALAAATVLEAALLMIPVGKFLRYVAMACVIGFMFYADLLKAHAAIQRSLDFGPQGSDDYGALQIRAFMSRLEASAGENRRILFYGPNLRALFYTDLVPASKFIYNIPCIEPQERDRERLEAFKKFEPKVALIGNYSPSGVLGQYVEENYIRQEEGAGGFSFIRKK